MVGGWKFVGGEGDIETGGLEDITAEELDRLQPRTSDPRDTTQQQVRLLPGETPPPSYRETSSFKLQASSFKPHEVHDLKAIDAMRKEVALQSVREEPTVHAFTIELDDLEPGTPLMF